MNTTTAILLGLIGTAFLAGIIVSFLMAFPVMWCWNYLMPIVFGLPKISFLQALVMNVLSNLVLKTSTTIKNN